MAESLVVPLLAGIGCGFAANYFADSLPINRRLSLPACGHCGASFDWGTYLTGKPCPQCSHGRGPRLWIVLAVMIGLSTYTWLQPHPMGFLLGLLLLTYFAVVVIIDLEHRLILHPTSVVGAILAAGIGLWLRGPLPTLLGGLIGLGVMLLLYALGLLFSRLRARRLRARGLESDDEDALGWGDVILGGILGLVLGWPLVGLGLFVGILLGGIVGLALILATIARGHYGQQALMQFMPYGPAFIASAFLILFAPNLIAGIVPK